MSDMRFMLLSAVRDLDEFKEFAEQAARLKPFGTVLMNVGTLAAKARHEMPEVWSAWHEYAISNPSLHKVFPHPKIAPHVPADYVKKNRELLLAKAAVVRELGLGAWVLSQEPYFMPESFFREHPHLRGPRIDHPRRSRGEEFAMCTDLAEVREMYEWMMAEYKRNVPELGFFMFNTNDAGSGFCWAEWLYSGPNGPKACRFTTAGDRIGAFMEALHRGAEAGGGDVTVYIGHVNFRPEERADVLAKLPPNSGVRGHDDATMGVGSHMGADNPVRGLINPLGILEGMERIVTQNVRNAMIHLGAIYHRAGEFAGTVERVLDIVIGFLEKPVTGLRARLDRLHELALAWAGEEKAEEVTEALYDLDAVLKAKQLLVGRYSLLYCAVSMRFITRPLLFDPNRITPEEEDYFLPHVFNVRESEARNDYTDLHGGHMQVTPAEATEVRGFPRLLERLRRIAEVLESATDGPEGEWLFNLATSVRIYASALRSIDNFYFGQLIRNRSADALAREEPVIPVKAGSWEGEGEILAWNERMRDEFDNAIELIALLEERGTDQLTHAENPEDEDTFLLGPDIIDQLKKKVKIMRDHWLDVERYLAPPHK